MPHYKTVADYLVDHRARDLAKQTIHIVCTKLQIKPPALRWIADDDFGPKWFAQDVAGFCSKDGNEISIHKNLNPFSIANTIAHECRHSWQIQKPKRFPIPGKNYSRTMNREQAERDCRIFEMEFWNGREKPGGSFDDILRILTDMRIASARLSRPAETESSDDLRRRFAPVLKARSLEVQQFVDPKRQGLFPPGIEFGSPCATLKVSYQK